MVDHEALNTLLVELREALRGGQFDPLNEQGALRRGIRAELQAQLVLKPVASGLLAGGSTTADPPPPGAAILTVAGSQSEPGLQPNFEKVWVAQVTAEDADVDSGGVGEEPDTPPKHHARMKTELTHKNSQAERLAESEGLMGRAQRMSYKLAHEGYSFDVAMGIIILMNSLSVGLELQWDLEEMHDYRDITYKLEHVFLVMFVLELIIRILADGRKSLKSSWFRFDVLLVALGAVSAWIVQPIVGSKGDTISDIISQLLIMRVLRLLRLIRALRLVELFRDLWKLVSGLMGSIRTVISACSLVMLALYIFACLGIELITRNNTLLEDPVTAQVVREHFPSLQVTMLTLVQFANADSIAAVYTPLVVKAWYLVFYFAAVWLVVTISLMNLVTAVIVDNAIARGGMDREMEANQLRKQLKAMEPHIRKLFAKMDSNRNGQLSLKELQNELRQLERGFSPDIPEDLHDVLDPERLADLFEFLDTDGSGEVDEEEFFYGVCSLMLQTVPIETTQSLQLLRSQARMLHLVRDVICLQGGYARLAFDHTSGAGSVKVVVAPRLQVGRDATAENTTPERSSFHVPLTKPLERAHAAGAHISAHHHLH